MIKHYRDFEIVLTKQYDQLVNKIIDDFDESELHDLCSDMGLKYEALDGEGKEAKVQVLIAGLDQCGQMDRLVKRCARLRSCIELTEVTCEANLGIAPSGYNLSQPVRIVLPDDRVRWIEARQGRQSESELAQIGQRLFQSIIIGELAEKWYACVGEVRAQPNIGLRLRFSLQANVLTQAPLELLCSRTHPTKEFLALDTRTPIVRSPLSGSRVDTRPPLSLPLKMLVVIANPNLTSKTDPIVEQQNLENALADLVQSKRLILDYMGCAGYPDASYNNFHHKITQTDSSYDIVHFIGHGSLPESNDRATEGVLLFVNPRTKDADPVRASDLAGTLANNGVAFVFLQACEGARTGTDNAFQGIAHQLVAKGLPAVVAMQSRIDKSAATTFCGQVYNFWLAEGGLPIERAITEARQSIRHEFDGHAAEWWKPVLLTRPETDSVLRIDLSQYASVSFNREKSGSASTQGRGNLKSSLRSLLSDPNNLTSTDFNTLVADFEASAFVSEKATRVDQARELVDYIVSRDQTDEFITYLQRFRRLRQQLHSTNCLSQYAKRLR